MPCSRFFSTLILTALVLGAAADEPSKPPVDFPGLKYRPDAGKTWTHVWKQECRIGTMEVCPKNPDIAFAAVVGRAFGPNPERGVYRTLDGGKTWQQILKKEPGSGARPSTSPPARVRTLPPPPPPLCRRRHS